MKAYTTKANAKRAAKSIAAKHSFVAGISGEAHGAGFAAYITVTCKKEDIPTELFETAIIDPVDPALWEDPTVDSLVKKEKASNLHKSIVANPCRVVWDIADSMPDAKRKEVLEACVQAGIAFYTARTQYQQWKKATKG